MKAYKKWKAAKREKNRSWETLSEGEETDEEKENREKEMD